MCCVVVYVVVVCVDVFVCDDWLYVGWFVDDVV